MSLFTSLLSLFADGQEPQQPPPAPLPALRFQEMIVLAADLSPSMLAEFRLPHRRVITRLDALKEAATFFLTHKAAASRLGQVSIVGFAHSVMLCKDWTPLAQLDNVLASIRSLQALDSATNLAGALELALNQVARFRTHPVTRRQPKILLVTDGVGNVDTHKHDLLIARARDEDVRLFTVAVCNRRDDPSSYDRDLLARMARETRGRFSTAHSLDQLKRSLAAAY